MYLTKANVMEYECAVYRTQRVGKRFFVSIKKEKTNENHLFNETWTDFI